MNLRQWEVEIRRKISFLTEIDFAILEDYLKALPSYAVYFIDCNFLISHLFQGAGFLGSL